MSPKINQNNSSSSSFGTNPATQEAKSTLNASKEMQLIGGVSLDIGPPPSLISFFKHKFTYDVIIRDFHLLDFSYGDSVCESKGEKRLGIADTTANAT
jgi:hypothetical protein